MTCNQCDFDEVFADYDEALGEQSSHHTYCSGPAYRLTRRARREARRRQNRIERKIGG